MKEKELSKYYIDENIVGLIASQIIVLYLVSVFTHASWLMLLLTLDFALRAFTLGPSLLAAIAKVIAALVKMKPKLIFAAPKKFAALLGFLFSLVTSLLLLFNFYPGAYTMAGILITCAILESIFKICLGCYVYDWLVAPIINKRNNNKHD